MARLPALLAVLLAGLAAAACTATPDPTAAGGTRVVTDIEGTRVTVPERPERVVTLSEPTLDGTLALGVTPVGTTTGRGQSGVPNYLAGRAGGIPLLGSVAQPNFEAIGKARPDLILVDGTSVNNNPPVIALLRKIAPTVYAGYAGGDWRATFGYVAEALNRADRGREILAGYDTRVSTVHGRLGPRLAETYSVVRWQGSSASLILKELPAGLALTDLGLRRPPGQDRTGRGHSEPVSLENLAEIDADWMFFGTLGGSSVGNPEAGGGAGVDAARAALTEARAVPGFTALKAYRAGRIVPVDGSLWTSTGGPLLMNLIVDDVERALTGS
ncbi:iron-siderophore ABC transporter substrate-binding protein [Phytohabitans sp. ZYX-F-186]|uniref:Iron-siderophore ABC transporter substrate-binding protein n=1 Tax=Phytohabitans maris TaxID=3071409 RepID=A0ABU0Z967_9ACTN|nr:iron-siderophore ABC transporter substrate-binding protein [Phytohabitans sp. ZYX-F-186]MDQ7903584.1 iron-siderophore ABC transporter substrate-binding protein [Phytohabitans sp. ZYX-F-186]